MYPVFDYDVYAYFVTPSNPDSNHAYFIVGAIGNHSGQTLTVNPYDFASSNYDLSIHITLPDQSNSIHTFMPVSVAGWLMAPPTDDLSINNPYYADPSGYSAILDQSYNKYFYTPTGTNTGAPVGAPYNISDANVRPFYMLWDALTDNRGIRLFLDGSLVNTVGYDTLGASDYGVNLKTYDKINAASTGLDLYPWARTSVRVDTSTNWDISYGDRLDISFSDLLDGSGTWTITPDLPDGLTFNVVTSSMVEITGTPTEYDVEGTTYTINSSNSEGESEVNINIAVNDEYIRQALLWNIDTSVTEANTWTIGETTDFSGYMQSSNSNSRRTMINLLFSRIQNSNLQTIRTTKTDLGLPGFFTKDNIIVYPNNTTIDLSAMGVDEGVYVPTYNNGETVTFLNVGGLQTVNFTMSGDGIYKYNINGVDGVNTYVDGDQAVIAGVSFIFGSIGTEGTNNGNVCLASGSPIAILKNGNLCYVPIEQLKVNDVLADPDGIVLGKVQNVIRSINEDPWYIKIPKDRYGPNMPFTPVLVSQTHLVQDDSGKWIPATDLTGTEKVPMSKCYVYNVYADNYTGMCVAGIAAETLHPHNINVHTRKMPSLVPAN